MAREESEVKSSFVIFKMRKTIPHLSVIGNDPVETKKLTSQKDGRIVGMVSLCRQADVECSTQWRDK